LCIIGEGNIVGGNIDGRIFAVWVDGASRIFLC
jgi:hypothetical protein